MIKKALIIGGVGLAGFGLYRYFKYQVDLAMKYDYKIKNFKYLGIKGNDVNVSATIEITNKSNFKLEEEYNTKPVFKNVHGWTIKTPPGWSSYITHPIGYPDLPFKSISAMVDTDLLVTEINTPFTFKKNWSGILEKGTPMFQIIPFERNSWKAKYSFITEQQHKNNIDIMLTKLKSSYLKYFREKRSYT